MAPLIGTGIPWYERDDYAEVVRIMADGNNLAATYDAWEQQAEQTESLIRQRGGIPIRVPLNSQKFRAWCMLRGKNVDASARLEFAADPSNWPNKH